MRPEKFFEKYKTELREETNKASGKFQAHPDFGYICRCEAPNDCICPTNYPLSTIYDLMTTGAELRTNNYKSRVNEQTLAAHDLWCALGCDPEDFDSYLKRNGFSNLWAGLMHAVKELRGVPTCNKLTEDSPGTEDERCVLFVHDPEFPCYGPSDVGTDEPIPYKRFS